MTSEQLPPYCFILSWERPIYLWATLYSLYRNTKTKLRFVVIDNNSSDPMVAHVIRSFERRGMFEEVRFCVENDPQRLQKTFREFQDRLGEFFYVVENDVMVPEQVCWADTYEKVFRAHPKVAMVGSLCEPDDFTNIEVVRQQNPHMSERDVEYYGYGGSLSVERNAMLDPTRDATIGDFPNPPGRLLLLATAAVAQCGMQTDSVMARNFAAAGYSWYITPRFRHRHLSLMAYFDYPSGSAAMPVDYATARRSFFRAVNGNFARRLYNGIRRRLAHLGWFV